MFNFEHSLSAQNSIVRKFAPRCNQKIRRFEIIKTIIDLHSGRIAYPVFDLSEILERTAGQNIGVPWEALKVDAVKKEFILNVEKSRLENATGFDKESWPDMADPAFGSTIYRHFGFKPYWEDAA